MRARARRAGVTILDFHPATEVLLHGDGSVAGASGIRLQEGGTWSCLAPAVILATGGTAFLSRLLGANNNTADGHLMAAEGRRSVQRDGVLLLLHPGRRAFDDDQGVPVHVRHLPRLRWRRAGVREPKTGLPMIARALIRGPVTVVLDRMPRPTRERLPHVQPNFLLPLLRKGIDPFNDPFRSRCAAKARSAGRRDRADRTGLRGRGGGPLRGGRCRLQAADRRCRIRRRPAQLRLVRASGTWSGWAAAARARKGTSPQAAARQADTGAGRSNVREP